MIKQHIFKQNKGTEIKHFKISTLSYCVAGCSEIGDIAVQYKENIRGMKLTHPGGMLRVICFLCGKSTKSNTKP